MQLTLWPKSITNDEFNSILLEVFREVEKIEDAYWVQQAHNKKVNLLKIEDSFFIQGRGLMIAPSFDIPSGKSWKNLIDTVTIETPDNKIFEAEALFTSTHFQIKDLATDIKKRWQIHLSLQNVNKEDVPIGSVIYVSPEIKNVIMGI